MKRNLLLSLLLLLFFGQLKAQPFQLSQMFNHGFESHIKEFNLYGKVKKLTETDSVSKMKYVPYKQKVEFVMVWAFNTDGNYKEIAEYSASGAVLYKDVFVYNNKGKVFNITHFSNNAQQWINVFTADTERNSYKIETFLTGLMQPVSTREYVYSKQGKPTEWHVIDKGKPGRIYKFAFDNKGNVISSNADDGKTLANYDKNNQLVELTDYDKAGKIYMHELYKNDQWGNLIEEKVSTDGGEFDTETISYIYDAHHNWIQQIRTGPSRRVVKTRVIEYF
jgi:YD repeat-containing protein